MKTGTCFILASAALLSACGNKDGQYDASGVFEATEVVVSAMATGELTEFDLLEGQPVEAGRQVGLIDTAQLYLKKVQLRAHIRSADSRYYDVSTQIASIRQQIATQKTERQRFENLVASNAANRKQLDDVNAQISILEKQLAAQTETFENNNRNVSGEILGLEAQIAQIEDQIRKSVVSSPVDGTVLSKYAERGEFAAQGRALFRVADLSEMYLRVYVTADQLTSLKPGQQVGVFADQGRSGRREYAGTVAWISDRAEFTPKTIQTRDERANLVYAVKVSVPNDGYIKKGMYGEIRIN